MPQLESGKAKFSFRQINVADSFTKAKTDMIYLSEGVLSPGEVRLERGLDPEGVVEKQPTAENANLSGGKDQDKTEESVRVENRNLTGDREA
jgi:hypothetical protein